MRDEHAMNRKYLHETQSSTHLGLLYPSLSTLSRNPEDTQQGKLKKQKSNNFKTLAITKDHPTFFYSKTNPFHHAGSSKTQAAKKPNSATTTKGSQQTYSPFKRIVGMYSNLGKKSRI
jgi:hypothetical protein